MLAPTLQTDPAKIPELTLQDTSKYGTTVNDTRVTDSVTLHDGDKVLFGNHSSNYRYSVAYHCRAPDYTIVYCLLFIAQCL